MTGAQHARFILGHDRVKQTLGQDCYHAQSCRVYLSRETFEGDDFESWAKAMHEVAHAMQHDESPFLFMLGGRWPFRLWLEHNAWENTAYLMRDIPQFDHLDIKTEVKRVRKKYLQTYMTNGLTK
jgi:hypothetical protein